MLELPFSGWVLVYYQCYMVVHVCDPGYSFWVGLHGILVIKSEKWWYVLGLYHKYFGQQEWDFDSRCGCKSPLACCWFAKSPWENILGYMHHHHKWFHTSMTSQVVSYVNDVTELHDIMPMAAELFYEAVDLPVLSNWIWDLMIVDCGQSYKCRYTSCLPGSSIWSL